ncbi:acetyl/propionyl/methylcrotonyl-CoA carboxylase subunit alpha [Smaragdicoccus niigatensis]|uniref:acetyl/propionyl/methylcrotonyl-CoA carboxylase subunit alpha n=1 Tax=Smaragdicoccus niigatensis TaxID=359359 RepID=UPI00037B5F0E|nr:acetyl-CoA carboxylase biotin carboxylase subunit [Smaragdicoccus niigatensis]
MFDKVLIANRGEIAVRVIRACRKLGVTSVAVHSDADADALHVRLADEAYRLPGNTAAETYLNVDAIMSAVRRSGPQAVHPGYGFLSESTLLADALTAEGRTFIGPSAAVIDSMGSKITARKLATAAGVPSVPGVADAVVGADEVLEFASEHGFPIAIKASFGGGGRGIRVVRYATEVADALEAAQREALSYFGRGDVFLERYLDRPRHVEIQILADAHGNAVWVGDRDCSVQRRHQKLIEEAPASVLDADLRARMGEAAVALAREVGYVNAGTVEFLVEDDEFYFLEMNTRLQVEHPVTEMVTGIDLVVEQLRIAAGEALNLRQSDIVTTGHAIEIRINAEDPAGGRFIPTPGTLKEIRWPSGAGVRVDHGYESGDTVSEYYDGLVAKLIVHGRDRADAIERTKAALDEFSVTGIKTTVPAQRMILDHEDFVADRHYTRWLEDTVTLPEAFRIPAQRSVVTVAGRQHWIPRHGVADHRPPGAMTERQARVADAQSGDGTVRSPMQGTVVKVLATVGQTVQATDVICVVEAMKMENVVRADVDGTVRAITASVGATVAPGETLALIDRKEDAS